MTTLSIRDLRHKWPEAEALLNIEGEIVITRDSKPIAKLVRYIGTEKPRRRFDPNVHADWQKRMNEGKVVHLVDKYLMVDRENKPSP
ncbi:MAG TPA: hypothetical protein VIT91_21915 [Chthoniobacterales bacterium]